MKFICSVVLICALGLVPLALITGCKTPSVNATTFNIENVLGTGAKDATHVFNQQYVAATSGQNPPANIEQLNATRNALYQADEQLGKSIKLITALRQQVVATSGTNVTINSALTAAIVVAQTQFSTMSSLTNLVKFLK